MAKVKIEGEDGTQVFIAAANGLIAKLADAQKHATQKIREQSTRLRELEAISDPNDLSERQKEAIASRIVADFSATLSEFVLPEVLASLKQQQERAEHYIKPRFNRSRNAPDRGPRVLRG